MKKHSKSKKQPKPKKQSKPKKIETDLPAEPPLSIDMNGSMNASCREQALNYNRLPVSHQAVVNILAVSGVPMTRIDMAVGLNKFPREIHPGKNRTPVTTITLRPVLDSLTADGLIKKTENNKLACSEYLIDAVCRVLVSRDLFGAVTRAVWPGTTLQEQLKSVGPYTRLGELRPKLRTCFYLKEYEMFHTVGDLYLKNLRFFSRDGYFEGRRALMYPLLLPFMNSFDAKWVQTHLPEDLQALLAANILEGFEAEMLFPMEEHLVFCESLLSGTLKTGDKEVFCTLLAECRLLEGKPEQAEAVSKQAGELSATLIAGDLAFLRGDHGKALDFYDAALALDKKPGQNQNLSFKSLSLLFFVLALLKRSRPEDLHQAKMFTEFAIRADRHKQKALFDFLDFFIIARQGDSAGKTKLLTKDPARYANSGLDSLILLLCFHWLNPKETKSRILHPILSNKSLSETLSPWAKSELSLLLSRYLEKTDIQEAEEFFTKSKYKSLVDLITPESTWLQALNTLILMGSDTASFKTAKTSRLAWLVTVNPQTRYWEITALEQTGKPNGIWTKGRPASLKRLFYEYKQLPFLTAQDKKVCQCIEMQLYSGWRGHTNAHYGFNKKALPALAGHPLVFLADSPATRLEITTDKPTLLVRKKQNGEMEMAFADNLAENEGLQILFDSPTRIRVMEMDEDVQRILRIIGTGITVPETGKEQLLKAVASVSSMVTVQSEVVGIGDAAEMVEADPRPHFYLRPIGAGFKLDIRVQPFTDGGPLFRPGEGAVTILSDLGGRRIGTQRDFDKEKDLANAGLKTCAPLSEMESADASSWEWELADPEIALEVLLSLTELQDRIIIKWPDGEAFTIRQQADFSQLSMRVRKEHDWFELSGELKLDDGQILSMEKLLELVQSSHGRFITLSDGQFLALTRSLKKRLEEIASFSKKSGKNRRFHPLAALSLEPLADEAGLFHGDKDWKAHLKRFQNARVLQPELPSTLRAELRDYQMEGFTWLVRLMEWGVGACLADDMGLGKTVQALAALLTCGARGPCLVVAPTSVCMNWEKEALRFAPSFNPIGLGIHHRDKTLAGLKPFDLLIISYGLLQQEDVAEKLGLIPFAAIVLDEAQAIKNFATKRSQAAMSLKADFRLITTGTPLENHLGELWNLFRFINPGLLGSLKSFNENFAVPIERDQDRNASRQLKKLIRPFTLRRTKDQVLEALPERTDIQLQVDLSDKEMAFYEALRRKAIENIEEGDAPMENKRMQILAEIMKLRRACCNPNLVAPDLGLPSAKLETFGEIVDELLANGHKALVFSQFTGHLDLIRTHVEKKGIAYQYLDGATPQKERAKRVNAFQAGVGDLFLISLRAGGVGLNLTAADYVIHMDPWWNPAVEDQASDRVHRIGQTRPVTVYSLVARGTIEEKILGLHHAKRALADSLLDGTDMSGKISAAELLALIREG